MTKGKQKVRRIGLSLPECVYEELEKIAEAQGLTPTTYAAALVARVVYLEKQEKLYQRTPLGKASPPDSILRQFGQVSRPQPQRPDNFK